MEFTKNLLFIQFRQIFSTLLYIKFKLFSPQKRMRPSTYIRKNFEIPNLCLAPNIGHYDVKQYGQKWALLAHSFQLSRRLFFERWENIWIPLEKSYLPVHTFIVFRGRTRAGHVKWCTQRQGSRETPGSIFARPRSIRFAWGWITRLVLCTWTSSCDGLTVTGKFFANLRYLPNRSIQYTDHYFSSKSSLKWFARPN